MTNVELGMRSFGDRIGIFGVWFFGWWLVLPLVVVEFFLADVWFLRSLWEARDQR